MSDSEPTLEEAEEKADSEEGEDKGKGKKSGQPLIDLSRPSAGELKGSFTRWFNDRQKRMIASALTLLSLLVVVIAVGAFLMLCFRFVNHFSSVFMPLAVALILALVIKPYFEWIHRHDAITRPMAIGIIYLSALIPITLFGWFFGGILVDQSKVLAREVTATVAEAPDRVENWSREWFAANDEEAPKETPPKVVIPEMGPASTNSAAPLIETPETRERLRKAWKDMEIGVRVREFVQSKRDNLLGIIQSALSRLLAFGVNAFQTVTGLLAWFVVPIYLAFFLMMPQWSRGEKENMLQFLSPQSRKDIIYLIEEFMNIMVSFFRGQLLVASAQGMLFAVGFSVVGLRFGFLIGIALGFLNLVPFLGSMVGLVIALPLAFFQPEGGVGMLAMVCVVFTVVQAIEGYVLTPRIMGERTGLHPLAIIVAIFFWGAAFQGVIGMVLAIPLTAFLVVLWRLGRKKDFMRNIA